MYLVIVFNKAFSTPGHFEMRPNGGGWSMIVDTCTSDLAPGFLFQLSHFTNRYRCVSGDPGENDMDSDQQKVSQNYLFMERNKEGTRFRFPEVSKPGTECPPLISKLHFPIDGFHCIGSERPTIPRKTIGVEKIPAF